MTDLCLGAHVKKSHHHPQSGYIKLYSFISKKTFKVIYKSFNVLCCSRASKVELAFLIVKMLHILGELGPEVTLVLAEKLQTSTMQ